MLALVLAAMLSAQQLEDQGRDLMEAQAFKAALVKLEEANQLEPTPERLLAMAQCHRELAFESARAAASKLQDRRSMTALAQILDELEAARDVAPRRQEVPMPEAAIAPPRAPRIELAAPTEPAPAVSSRVRWAIAGGGTGVALLATAALLHVRASSLVSASENPANGATGPERQSMLNDANTYQMSSNLALGAGLVLGVVSASLLVGRF